MRRTCLRRNARALDILAKTLLEKEVIVKSDVAKLIGPSPYHQDRSPSELADDGQHVTDTGELTEEENPDSESTEVET